ncbi:MULTISPECIES: alpha/beta fold hydrolase [unclassified Nocardia]|uniref:alpha/beta fold hydrolase n=1 Tax=unclassified Nocardia TaxID=2637762 RepID=UPI00339ED253
MTTDTPPTRFADVEWGRLAYSEHGTGDDVVVLLHQFLVDKRAQWPVAEYLAAQGYRVICVDLPGHGESDQPRSIAAYGLGVSADAVLQLLDALGLDRVFLGGASFGSQHALRIALRAPERLVGLWLEMPFADRGIRNVCYWGGPALIGYSFSVPLLRVLAPMIRRRGARSGGLGIPLSLLARDPVATRHLMIGTLSHGIRPWVADWRQVRTRTLVMGHPYDPVHVRADALTLSRELPDAEYLHAPSIVALRRRPERLMPEVTRFISRCYADRRDAVIPA